MTSIHDKDGVMELLERLERVCREVKGLPDFAKLSIALNAGCLVRELDNLEELVSEAKEHVESMKDPDEYFDLDLDNDDHYKAVGDAMVNLDGINERDQINIIKEALQASNCFDTNIEGLNSMLQTINKPWFVISTNERDTALEACKTLTTVLENE